MAKDFIPKGKIIWEYFPLIDITYSETEWREIQFNLSAPSYEKLEQYAYKERGRYIICVDNAQFMNHSEEKFNVTNTEDLKTMYAVRDIIAGEEILCNYFEYSDSDDVHRLKLQNHNK